MRTRRGRFLWPMVGAVFALLPLTLEADLITAEELVDLAERWEGTGDDERRLFGVSPGGNLRVSSDEGASWTGADLPATPETIFAVAAREDTVLAVGDYGTVYRSAAEGEAFAEAEGDVSFGSLKAVAPGPTDEWVAVGDEVIFFSADDGQSWTETTPQGLSFGEVFEDLAYDASAGLWVAVGAAGNAAMIWTSPDGNSWTEVSLSGSPAPLHGVAADGQGTFLAVGDGGTLLRISGPAYDAATPVEVDTVSQRLNEVALLPGGRFLAVGEDKIQYTLEPEGTSVGASDPVEGIAALQTVLVSTDRGSGDLFLALGGTNLTPEGLLLLSGEPDFGDRATNSGTVSQTLTVRNDGAADLSLTSLTGPSGNGFTSGQVQYPIEDGTLAPGEEATLEVTFSPDGLVVDTTYTGTWTVASSAGDGTLEVRARVVDPPVLTSTAPDDEIVVGREYSYAIATSSPTGDPVEVAVASGDTLPGWLTLTDHGDGTATLTGTPDQAAADAGAFSFDLVATVTATGGTATETITGEVLEPAVFGATPDPLDFGLRAVNASRELSWTLANTGEATLVVTGISYPHGAVYSDDGSFPLTIDGDGASATVTVTFQPTAVQDYSGTATFTFEHLDDAAVGLAGEGVAAPAFDLSSPPPATTEAGVLFSYGVTTTGIPEGHTATIEVEAGLPAWMSLQDAGEGTATLSGTPLAEQIGDEVDVVLQVLDETTGGSSTATFETTVVAPTSTSAYAVSEGVSAPENAPGEDPDGDGAPNLLEFALGTDPSTAGSRPVTHAAMLTVDGNAHPALHFLRRAGGTEESGSYTVDGLTYTVEGSTDLQSWTEPVTATSSADTSHLPTPPTGYEWTTHHLTDPQTRGFLRVVVSE